jgi:hypothetical protein
MALADWYATQHLHCFGVYKDSALAAGVWKTKLFEEKNVFEVIL